MMEAADDDLALAMQWVTTYRDVPETVRVVIQKHLEQLAALTEVHERLRETCICAAIQLPDGELFRGHRHDDAIQTAGKAGVPREQIYEAEQGFITSRNRFVGREEGARLQHAAGIPSADSGKLPTGMLFSEDLYLRSTKGRQLDALSSTEAAHQPLRVVVNGQPVEVTPGPVRDVIAQAIQRSGQIGAPIKQWELRTPDGDVIPHDIEGEWHLSGGKLLFLNLGLPAIDALLSPREGTQLMHDQELTDDLARRDTSGSSIDDPPQPPTGR